MKLQDDRTPQQANTHRWAVVARDKFMSGWGGATGGASRCAWAVPNDWLHDGSIEAVERWVRSRSEMVHVNVMDLSKYRCPRGTAHFHIYVVNDQHPAAPQHRRRTVEA